MNARIPLFAANWKMNKRIADVSPFMVKLNQGLQKLSKKAGSDFEVVIGPSATHLAAASLAIQGTPIELAAQNCGHTKSGAFTGEISPEAIKELHCPWVILGHSERRHLYLEDNGLVLRRLKAAWEEGLNVILCVGETLPQRKSQQTTKVVEEQLQILKGFSPSKENLVIAYEPVWAIGTGENATPDQAQEVHAFIRGWLKQVFSLSLSENTRILYGGSVKPENSKDLMGKPDVDGFLVGGASLEAESFLGIIENGLKSRG